MHLFKWTISWDILRSLVTVPESHVCSLCTLLAATATHSSWECLLKIPSRSKSERAQIKTQTFHCSEHTFLFAQHKLADSHPYTKRWLWLAVWLTLERARDTPIKRKAPLFPREISNEPTSLRNCDSSWDSFTQNDRKTFNLD